jgi:hypothetical protein
LIKKGYILLTSPVNGQPKQAKAMVKGGKEHCQAPLCLAIQEKNQVLGLVGDKCGENKKKLF